MAADADRILHEAMELSDGERAAIAGKLIESLDESIDEADVTPLWATEIASRLQEIDDGTVKCVPWDEARRQICESADESTTD